MKLKILLLLGVHLIFLGTLHAQIVSDTAKIKTFPKEYKDIKYDILGLKMSKSSLDFNSDKYKYKAFFCRMEDVLYKKTGKNFRFRLGNLDYVNILEHK